MHDQRFAKGAGLADQYAAALAQRTINGLDDTGLAFAFGAAPLHRLSIDR